MAKQTNREEADFYQELFNHMHGEHNLILTITEMDEIIRISNRFVTLMNEWAKS